jgi:CubicO group peptidase (beta-lactamase class C family)/beta-glucosidase-like glycosyl hydrolase
MPRYLLWQALILFLLFSCNHQPDVQVKLNASFLDSESTWVDSMLLEMSLEEKIGQLILFKPEAQLENLEDSLFQYAEKNYLGGVMLKGLDFFTYQEWINSLQSNSRIPLFNASNEQVSMTNQFIGLQKFPLPVTIGANANDSLINNLVSRLVVQNKRLAVNLSLAPNIDRLDPSKGTFDFHVFQDDPTAIMKRSSKMLEMLKSEHILSIAGSFKDYHLIENDTTCELENILIGYSNLIQNGVSGIYIDPIIFEIDTLPALPKHFLQWYLKRHLDFDGLMVADWTEDASFEELLHAGVDVFIVKDSVETRLNYIKKYVDEGLFSKKDLNNRVRKVLQAKKWIGLENGQHLINQEEALAAVNEEIDELAVRKLYESSLTILQNPKNLLPFKETYKRDFRIINIGQNKLKTFNEYFSKYAKHLDYTIKTDVDGKLKPINYNRFSYSKLIVTIDNIDLKAKRDSVFIQSINNLASNSEVVIVNFGNPFNFYHFNSSVAMVQSYERNKITESLTAQLLFGALQAKGKLPLTISNQLPFHHGIDTTPVIRFKYTIPEEVGIAAYKLVGIDAIARNAIGTGVTPGCQVLVAKEGKIIYSKSFGSHTYENEETVKNTDIYDLASITKIASTTLATMKMFEQKQISLDGKVGDYLDIGEKAPIRDITIDQLLTHKSGLQANMPIAPYIMHKDTTDTFCNKYFCQEKFLTYIVPIADSFYMDYRWRDTMWQKIYQMKPFQNKRFRYSDVNFNLLQKIVETKSNVQIDEYVKLNFYYPLNLERLTYKPLEVYDANEIVPTSEDYWRKQLLRGYVHDEAAALLGGVGGNAGLFSNAEDLAVVFQMMLNGGSYGGKEYLQPETIRKFTSQQVGSLRGLGFDVQTKSGSRSCSTKASPSTFGHTGFTGTCVWVDPETELIYIFLSNRIHPKVKNRMLFTQGTRKRIQSLVYDAMNTYPESENQKREPRIMRADVKKSE